MGVAITLLLLITMCVLLIVFVGVAMTAVVFGNDDDVEEVGGFFSGLTGKGEEVEVSDDEFEAVQCERRADGLNSVLYSHSLNTVCSLGLMGWGTYSCAERSDGDKASCNFVAAA